MAVDTVGAEFLGAIQRLGCPAQEAARILRRLADDLEGGLVVRRLLDVNGNTVGHARLVEED